MNVSNYCTCHAVPQLRWRLFCRPQISVSLSTRSVGIVLTVQRQTARVAPIVYTKQQYQTHNNDQNKATTTNSKTKQQQPIENQTQHAQQHQNQSKQTRICTRQEARRFIPV